MVLLSPLLFANFHPSAETNMGWPLRLGSGLEGWPGQVVPPTLPRQKSLQLLGPWGDWKRKWVGYAEIQALLHFLKF